MKGKFSILQFRWLVFFFLFFIWISSLYADRTLGKKYDFKELFTIGVEGDDEKKDEPYQFYKIISIDCDNQGHMYILDYSAVCVKEFDQKGKFIKRFFRQGKAPDEISNAFSISINRYTDHMFILQDYGFTLKEFDLNGNYVKYHVLPRQFFGKFFFLDEENCLHMNSVPQKDNFNNFYMINVVQKKIIKEFAPVEMMHVLNFKQYYTVTGDSILWTSMGNEMTLLAFDLKTGKKIQVIRIPGKYKENRILETTGSGDMNLVVPILYNVAQPFVIDDQLFTLVALQEYREKNGKIERFPFRWKRIIYQVNGSRFVKSGEVENGEDIYIGTVFKNRLILYSNEPYGRVKVLEFK